MKFRLNFICDTYITLKIIFKNIYYIMKYANNECISYPGFLCYQMCGFAEYIIYF